MPKHRNKYRDPVKRSKPLTAWTPENWKRKKDRERAEAQEGKNDERP